MLRTYERYSRRICWPNPDRVCIEGGCVYCNNHEWRKVSEIAQYVEGRGNTNLEWSLRYGATHNFHNAELRDDTSGALL